MATGELALRIVYHDAGTRTSGGPGGRRFEYLKTADDRRGRMDIGPKIPNIPRMMIVGDSITWGQGVRDWQDTWPERLARELEQAESPYQLAVFGFLGRDIQAHVDELDVSLQRVDPDVFIYQWYVNDIEVDAHRPRFTRAWQRWQGHESLRSWSYLYYFLDNRLASFLPTPERSYVDYLLQDYAPGSFGWSEFERYFHTLATRAKEAAKTRLLVIYPQVPFRGRAPLQPIYDRVIALAAAHRLAIGPAALIRYGGQLATTPQAAVRFVEAPTGPAIDTRAYYFSAGDHEVDLTVSIDAMVPTFGTLDVLDATTNERLARAPLRTSPGGWHDLVVHVRTPERSHQVRLRITGNGQAPFSVAQVAFPVDYGFDVVDLTAFLNTFNTHASIFDAHPNEQAHQVIADQVLAGLRKSGVHH